MTDAANTPMLYPRTDFATTRSPGDTDGAPKCRAIRPPVAGGWTEPALFEWALAGESWTDEHPHTEYNFVIEGTLFVESGGATVEAHAGDVVCVPAGAVGRYWAPEFARLLAIYGPSNGAPSRRLGFEKLTPVQRSCGS